MAANLRFSTGRKDGLSAAKCLHPKAIVKDL
jgi:hypothetical protein